MTSCQNWGAAQAVELCVRFVNRRHGAAAVTATLRERREFKPSAAVDHCCGQQLTVSKGLRNIVFLTGSCLKFPNDGHGGYGA